MIRVEIKYDRDKREASIQLEGHAGQAEAGKDIVCASASILTYTTAHIVEVMHRHGDFASPPIILLESGNATILCRANDDDIYAEVLHTFFVIQTGYRLLAHNYPQYVELITDDKV